MLLKACRQARAWQLSGLQPIRIAVNVSGVQLQDGGFVEDVRAVLTQSGLKARHLELELSETSRFREVPSTGAVLQELKDEGVQLAFDDFGTGYSSLSHLKRFPIDTVKIDQSFVRNLPSDVQDGAIVGAIIAMGAGLKVRVVAEGIETADQLAFLQGLNCLLGQGHHLFKPKPALEMTQLLERNDAMARAARGQTSRRSVLVKLVESETTPPTASTLKFPGDRSQAAALARAVFPVRALPYRRRKKNVDRLNESFAGPRA